jgi:S1-C subfamily serine protease
MPGLADGQRFCQRCGTALDDGRCPRHGADVSTTGTVSPLTLPLRAPRRYSEAPAAPPAGAVSSRYGDPPRPDFQSPGYGTATRPEPAPPAPPVVAPPPPIHNVAWAAPTQDVSWPPKPAASSVSTSGRASDRARASRSVWVMATLAAVLLVALIADHLYLQGAINSNHQTVGQLDQRLAAQLAAMNALASKVGTLENQSSDPAKVAATVRASVYTIETPDGLGSGWVVNSAGGSSNIITDYHVVASVWTAPGAHTVQVRQDTKTLTGTITKVDKGDDLAVVNVKATLAALPRSTTDAVIGDTVLVVGSPLGLSGTVANGIVSAFRNGLIQFSAPISPGDSGGPVVNRKGQVIGVAESKLVGSGVEGLSFAIPITTVCTVATC